MPKYSHVDLAPKQQNFIINKTEQTVLSQGYANYENANCF